MTLDNEEFSKVPGGRYNVASRPGYGGTEDTYPYMHNTGTTTDLAGTGNGKEPIGVDCGGLVYMSAAYSGSQYTLQSLNKGKRTPYLDLDTLNDPPPITTDSNILSEIQKKENISEDNRDPLPNANLMVPGDIFYWANTEKNYYHVGFVGWISSTKNPAALNASDITFLESTVGKEGDNQNFGRVISSRPLEHYYRTENWRIGRIKQ